jgi:hypothetical protein
VKRTRGRPTDDPKTELLAVRLTPRQVELVERRAELEAVSVSEAIRRCLDESFERYRGRPKKK